MHIFSRAAEANAESSPLNPLMYGFVRRREISSSACACYGRKTCPRQYQEAGAILFAAGSSLLLHYQSLLTRSSRSEAAASLRIAAFIIAASGSAILEESLIFRRKAELDDGGSGGNAFGMHPSR